MDTRDSPELGPALLRWVNSFGITDAIDSWKPLQDGSILWKILQNVEPAYFSGDLPEDVSSSYSNWIPRWQNLKYINRAVMAFIRDECGKLQELSKRMNPDLKAMATDASAADSIQLTKAVLLAAMYSPESNQRMILVIDKLGTRVGIALASCISQMEQLDHKLAESAPPTDVEFDSDRMSSPEPDSASGAKAARVRDPELEREEKLIQAYAHIKELQGQTEALTHELERSRDEIGRLQDDHAQLRYRLEQGHGGPGDESALELLKQRADYDKESIAQLEAELADARSAIESQDKQLERLNRESESYQKQRDELQMLKIERDELQQKSKANENLKKKIQTLQDSDRSNQKLREDFATAEQELQTLRPLKTRVAALQKANEESMKLVQNGEQEIFDQKTTRKRLDHDLRMLKSQLDTAKELHQRDQETIREQDEKIREFNSGTAENGQPVGSLDDEFASRDKAFSDLQSKNAELEAEVAKLKESQVNQADELALPDQTAYDMLKARCEKLEKQYLDAYQENLGLESTIKLAEDSAHESQPFVEMRERLKTESEQKLASEKRLFDIEAELAETKLRLQSADSKLSAVGKDQADALDELQQSASTENQILHTENTRLLQHIRTYDSDLEEHRSLLRHALLDKRALFKQEPNQRFKDELKLVTEQMRAVVDKPERTDEMAMHVTQRIEDARQQVNDAEAQSAKQLQAHQDEIADLKARAKKSEEAATMGAKNPNQENLQRELSLMTSAWYDVTRRLQSDAVIVQRRSEMPRSFLNRQRKLMDNPVIPRR